MYVLLTGRQPFGEPTEAPSIILRRITDSNWKLDYPPYVSETSVDLVSRLMTRDPGVRMEVRIQFQYTYVYVKMNIRCRYIVLFDLKFFVFLCGKYVKAQIVS